MIRQPPIVKIVVPIPPVPGRALSFVSAMEAVASTVAVAGFPSFNSNLASESVVFTLYPSGAFVSLK